MGESALWARLVAAALLVVIGVFVIAVGAGFVVWTGMVLCALGIWHVAVIAIKGGR